MLAGFVNINKYLICTDGAAGEEINRNGTEGRTRTDKVLLPGDFELFRCAPIISLHIFETLLIRLYIQLVISSTKSQGV